MALHCQVPALQWRPVMQSFYDLFMVNLSKHNSQWLVEVGPEPLIMISFISLAYHNLMNVY